MKDLVKFPASWRWSAKYCINATIGMTIVFAVIIPLFVLVEGRPIGEIWNSIVALSGPILFGLSFTAILTFSLGRFIPVKATPEGIVAGVKNWGKRGVVKWSDIRAVAPMQRRGLRLLKLTRGDSSIAYVALPLDNYSDLQMYVERHAGSENELAKWLRTAAPDA